jgi:divalent metal cation (Fe/Co/Zn/Cd) transporter
MEAHKTRIVERIEHQLHHVDGIADVGRVRARWVGHELHADADVSVRGDLPLGAASEILDDARRRLTSRVPRLTDVVIHAAPYVASTPRGATR